MKKFLVVGWLLVWAPVALAWTSPGCAPLNCDVNPPFNTSATPQTKPGPATFTDGGNPLDFGLYVDGAAAVTKGFASLGNTNLATLGNVSRFYFNTSSGDFSAFDAAGLAEVFRLAANGGQSWFTAGNLAVGTTAPVLPAATLDVNGTFRFKPAVAPSAGQVLTTTDATGLAAWQTPASGGGTMTSLAGLSGIQLYGSGGAPVGAITTNGSIEVKGTPAISANRLTKFSGAPNNQFNASQVFDNGSNVGVGTITPGAKLEINGGLRLNTATARPACVSGSRGTLWVTLATSGPGTKDSLAACLWNSLDGYAWRTIY